MTLKEELKRATEDHDSDTFVAALKKIQTKSQVSDLEEAVNSFSRPELSEIWDKVQSICTGALLSLEGSDGPDKTEKCLEEAGQITGILQCTVTLAHATLSCEMTSLPDSLLDTAVIMHGVLPSLPESEDKLKNSMVKLFETWWSKELDGKEELGQNSLIYLLERTLSTKSAMVDVKRVWSFREAVKQFDLNNPNSDHIRGLLLHCFIHVTYLKAEEGRRFLSFLFSLGPDIIPLLHQTIKNQLPTAPRSLLEGYGEVYFRAWRVASGESLQKIEIGCIQDLMHHAVLANRKSSRSLAHTLRKVLSYLHKQKKQRGVDEMLLRLYEPILWRSLKVANGNVRANAASLLVDTFPLQNPETNVEETDSILQKQFDILQGLLVDPCVEVRVVTIQGVCRIISVYWEVIPQTVIKALITKLFQDLIYDVSSAEVRVAVIKGQMELLDNHLCIPLLESLLPTLQDFIHDVSEKVRLSMLQLLLKVKSVRGIRFWSIVPMEHLLSRLEIDTPPVARSIMRLIFNSFVPMDKEPHVQLSRCIALLKSNPGAARCFYQYAHKHLTLEETVKYIVMLCRSVLSCVRSEQKNNQDGSQEDSNSDQDNEKENDSELSIKDAPLMVGLLEAMAILWKSISVNLDKPENEELKRGLRRKFAIAMPEFLNAFQNRNAYSALVMLSGFMPSQLVPHLSRSCLSRLKDMSDDSEAKDYGILLEAMCNWGKMTDLTELISEWLEEGLKIPEVKQASAVKVKKKTKKTVAFSDPRTPQPKLAVKFLSCLMSHPVCQAMMLTNCRSKLQELSTLLKSVLKCIEKRFVSNEQLAAHTSDEFLTQAFIMYQKLELLLHDSENTEHNAVMTMEQLYSWADIELLSALRDSSSANTSVSRKRKVDSMSGELQVLALQLVKSILSTGNNMLLIGIGGHKFITDFSDFISQCLQTGHTTELLPLSVQALYQLTDYLRVKERESDDPSDSHSSLISSLFTKFLQCLAGYVNRDDCQKTTVEQDKVEKLFASVKSPMNELLQTFYRCQNQYEQLIPEVMASIMATVISDLTYNSKIGLLDLDTECESLSDLPSLSAFILTNIFKKNYMIVSFMKEFEQCIKCGALTGLHSVNGAVYLTANLHTCKPSASGLKDCVSGLQTVVDKLQPDDGQWEDNNPDKLILDGLLSTLRKTQDKLMTV